MTVYCHACQKELWDKHAGTRRAHVICVSLDNLDGGEGFGHLFDWFCVPCFKKQNAMVKVRKLHEIDKFGKEVNNSLRQIVC